MITYEQRLSRDRNWAFREGSMHFEKESAVHQTLERIARRLDEIGVDYAIAGGMALFFHGYRRFTEDIDIVVNRGGLQRIHHELEGLGYRPSFEGSKNLRDSESGVRIEFLVSGDYPGDSQPKPVVFPDPAAARVEIDGKYFLTLAKLIELKLASGMTNPRRGQDLVDVQALIERLELPEDFAGQLDPFVQERYRSIWQTVHTYPE